MAAASASDSTDEFSRGGDVGKFCGDCFRSNLYGKFRFAVTSNDLISPTDNVLVAFSGGSSSRARGFSLAADIQYVDSRWEIPVVLPLRDCLTQELNVLCGLDSLKTVEVFRGPCSGIDGLISSFVKLLQEENPSRESMIVRAAGKLSPFHFNRMPEVDDCNDQLASQRRQKKYNLKINESLPPVILSHLQLPTQEIRLQKL